MASVRTLVSFFFYAALLLQSSNSRSVKEKSQLESALQRGDIELATELIRGGALEDFPGPKDRKKIDRKLYAVKLLLSNRIANNNTPNNDSEIVPNKNGAFDVVLIPGSSLITRMVINDTVVKNWGNKTIKNGWKPIHIITALPDVSPGIVQFFLENSDDDVNSKTKTDVTPLMIAANSDNLEVVKFLVERGARINDIIPFPMEGEEWSGHFVLAKLFSETKFSTMGQRFPPLGFTALVASVLDHNVEIVSYLLSKGAKVNEVQGWVLLFHAVYHGQIEIVKSLLRSGIDVNAKSTLGSTALHQVAMTGRVEMAKFLLENGAYLNATDALGWMPIHVASFFSKLSGKEMIQYLVQSGSGIQSVTDGGYTPLNLIEAGHNRNFLDYLIKNIDFLNQTNHYTNLPEAASNKSHAGIVESVIQLGAPLNHQDRIFGWTTLHWAAALGDLEVVKLLVKYRALTSVRSKMGRNPFETAKYFGRAKVAEFLRTAKDYVE